MSTLSPSDPSITSDKIVQKPNSFWLSARSNARLRQQFPAIEPAPRNASLPLSLNQQRIWFLEQLGSAGSVYTLQHRFELKGVLNIEALHQSLHTIAQRHEILRTTFPVVNGQPVQRIAESVAIPLPLIILEAVPPAQQGMAVRQLAEQTAAQPFDLTQGPLWRLQLIRLSRQHHVLLRTIHHIIFDGWSHGVFLRELTTLYAAYEAGKPSPLLDLPVQFADYATTERQWLQGEVLSHQLNFWQTTLSGPVPPLILPIDQPRPPQPSYSGDCQSLHLGASLTQQLKTLSYNQGTSLFVVLLTAFKLLLYRYTNQPDLVLCTPVAGRHRTEAKRLIGFFNNLVLLRSHLSAELTLAQAIEHVSQVVNAANEHQNTPLQQITELPELAPIPLTRAMFVLQNAPAPDWQGPQLTITSDFINRDVANFELSLSMAETAEGLTGALQHRTDLFHPATIALLLENLQVVLQEMVADPQQLVADLPRFQPSNPALLAAPETTPQPASRPQGLVPPRTELERQLVTLWQDLLQYSPIGITDSFFDLGGHSLQAVRLFNQIAAEFGRKLPLSTLMTATTIEALAQVLTDAYNTDKQGSLVCLQPGTGPVVLFLLHDGDGEVLLYRNLASRLAGTMAIYGIQPKSSPEAPITQAHIGEMAAYYIEQMRQVQPQGPYCLGGLCAGGVLAFEIALQLQQQGETVALVALMDAADVAAKKRSLSAKRLNSLKAGMAQGQQCSTLQRLGKILTVLGRKAINTLNYEISHRWETARETVQLNLLRYWLDRQLALPSWLQNIAVRRVMVFAQRDYRPQSLFQGSLLLLRSTQADPQVAGPYIDDQPYKLIYDDPHLGWDCRVQGEVEVVDLPGGHSSMLQEPYVEAMAALLQQRLSAIAAAQARELSQTA